jgi:predicted phage terminase large subunit-like protein
MSFPEAMAAVEATTTLFPWVGAKLVEDKANGPGIISMLQSKVPGLIARENNGGTYALAQTTSYMARAGNVWLPGKYDGEGNIVPAHPWVEEFVQECEEFPRGEYDDRVSSLAQLLFWFHERQTMSLDSTDLLAIGDGVKSTAGDGWLF